MCTWLGNRRKQKRLKKKKERKCVLKIFLYQEKKKEFERLEGKKKKIREMNVNGK